MQIVSSDGRSVAEYLEAGGHGGPAGTKNEPTTISVRGLNFSGENYKIMGA